MIIPTPISSQFRNDDNRIVRLFFEGGKFRDFYIRGAIAWPDGKNEGFAVLAGHTIDGSRQVWIFREFPFWTIENWTDEAGNIKLREDGKAYYLGLVQFISECFTKFKGHSWFWGGQHEDIKRRYALEVYRNPVTPRAFSLIEVPYVREVGDNLIADYFRRGQIKFDGNSMLNELFREAEIEDNNGRHVLRALFAGYEHLPWRDRGKREGII